MGSRCAKCGEPIDPWADGDGGDERCRCTPTPPAPAPAEDRDIWQHDETGRIVELPAGSPSPGKRYFRVRGMGGRVSVVGEGDEARVVFTPDARPTPPATSTVEWHKVKDGDEVIVGGRRIVFRVLPFRADPHPTPPAPDAAAVMREAYEYVSDLAAKADDEIGKYPKTGKEADCGE